MHTKTKTAATSILHEDENYSGFHYEHLNKNKPNQLAHDMEQCVSHHCVNNPMLAIQPTEYKSESAVEQETTE